MNKNTKKQRKDRVRSKITGTSKKPRISVFRSNKGMFVQMIDDSKGVTLVSVNQKSLAKSKIQGKSKTQIAEVVGEEFGKKAIAKKIKQAVFDKGSYKYHGRIKTLADAIRNTGIKF